MTTWSVWRHDRSALGQPRFDYYEAPGVVQLGDVPQPRLRFDDPDGRGRALQELLPSLPAAARFIGEGPVVRGRLAAVGSALGGDPASSSPNTGSFSVVHVALGVAVGAALDGKRGAVIGGLAGSLLGML